VKIAALADNPSRAGMLRHALHRGGHVVRCFGCGKSMTDAVRDARYDVLLLDRASSIAAATAACDVLKWVRDTLGQGVPVMMLGRGDDEAQVAACLAAGADAYVGEAGRGAELLARVEALARRAAVPGMLAGTVAPAGFGDMPEQLVSGVYRFVTAERQAWVAGVPVALAPKEFALALLLFRNLGTLVLREAMIRHVWPDGGVHTHARTVDSHLSRVRTKLALWPRNGVMLRAIHRLGSRLDLV